MILLIIFIVILCFGFVVLFGAPYLPTLKEQQLEALKLLNLKRGQTLIELGSGDGRMLIAAAKKGIYSIGYELNPLLYAYSYLACWRYRKYITLRFGNFWNHQLPPCDGIYVFLLDKYMNKLYKKIVQEISSSVKVVSFAFKMPAIKHVTEKSGLYLYEINNNNFKK